MKKCVVIYNPHSGKKTKKDFQNEFIKILEENDYQSEVIYSKYRGHIIEIVSSLDDDVDLVISLGGDGTFNESMRGNFKRKNRLVLAHIPLGTTNDVGGFGKFMNIPYETSRNSKKKLGYLAYIVNGFKDFLRFTRLHDITYVIDGEEYEGLYSFMFVSNATRVAGVNNVFKDVKLDDGKFEVLLCNIKKRKDILKTLYYLRKNDISHVPGFYFHKTDNLKIRVNDERKLAWCIDGEKLEIDSEEVEIKIDKNVKIMIPKTNIDKLFIENKKGN